MIIELIDQEKISTINKRPSKKKQRNDYLEQQPSQDKAVIALIDSGVSPQHEQLHSVNVVQFNPRENNFLLKDTGFGHGTGIFSLLAANGNHQKLTGLIPQAKFLSCNGLPNGQYDALYILECMNWFFLQKQVNVIINAWLANTPGCKRIWEYPIQTLWFANSIPVFSVGNKALSNSTDYSPVNLSPLPTPLISVGAIDKKNQPLASSSFGYTKCAENTNIVSIMAPGKDLTVAVPFTQKSYQLVSGTSYSVAFVGAAIAKLMLNYPHVSNATLVKTLLASTDKINTTQLEFYKKIGKLNFKKAVKRLNLNHH